MTRPLDLKMTLDASDVVRNTDRVADAMDDVADELENIADEGDDAAKKLSQDFRKIGRDADKAGADIGKAGSEGFSKVKEEASSSAVETAASFDGSAESIAGMLQEVAANLGPAGIAGAALIGAAIATFQAMADASEEEKQRISDAFRDMAEGGIAEWNKLEAVTSRLTDIWDENAEKIKEISDELGVGQETVALAWAGNKDALEEVEAALDVHVDKIAKSGDVNAKAVQKMADNYSRLLDPIRDANHEYDVAKQKNKSLTDSVSEQKKRERAEIEKTNQMYRDMYAPVEKKVKITVDSRAWDAWRKTYASQAANLSAIGRPVY